MATRPSAGSSSSAKRLPADRRRQQLLDVSLKLFAERGFNATTMDDIAEAAGVTKPLLYQHFESKRALYLELLDSVSHTMLEAIDKAIASAGGPRNQVEGGFAAYFHLVVSHADAFHLLFGSDVPNDAELSRAVRNVEDTVAESIDVLIDAGLDEDHRRLLAYAVVGMAEGASRHFLAARPPQRGPPRIGGQPPGAATGRPRLGGSALGPSRLRAKGLTEPLPQRSPPAGTKSRPPR